MLNDDYNLTFESLSNLVISYHCAEELRRITIQNWNKLILVQTNINSLKYKFELLSTNLKGNLIF